VWNLTELVVCKAVQSVCDVGVAGVGIAVGYYGGSWCRVLEDDVRVMRYFKVGGRVCVVYA
jgi:hypothetical protein